MYFANNRSAIQAAEWGTGIVTIVLNDYMMVSGEYDSCTCCLIKTEDLPLMGGLELQQSHHCIAITNLDWTYRYVNPYFRVPQPNFEVQCAPRWRQLTAGVP